MSAPGLRALVATELRLHRRHRVFAATAAMTAVWVAVLLALPASWRPQALAWVLLLDLAALGFFFAPALAVVERGNGVTAALGLTRLSAAHALAVRLTVLTASAVVAAAVLIPVGRAGAWLTVLTGVVLTSTLFSLLAVVMVGRADTLTTYMARVPAVATPLLLPVLLRGSGLADAPVFALSPATGALALLSGHWSSAHAVWVLAWVAALAVAAVRIGFDVTPRAQAATTRRRRPPRQGHPGWWQTVRSLAHADRRTLLDDRLLLLLLAGVPVTALAVRWFAGPGLAWAQQAHGVALGAHLPAVWALVLVLHTATMLGALGGLLFLEDRDAGLLPAIAVTPAGLRTLLVYRLSAVAGATAVLVVVGSAIAGARHPAGAVGVLLTAVAAGAVSVVPALLLAGLARDRVQGMALTKAMSVPLYAPVAWWFVDGPLGWLFALVPTAWAVRTWWAQTAVSAGGFALGAVAVSALLAVVLVPRVLRSAVS